MPRKINVVIGEKIAPSELKEASEVSGSTRPAALKTADEFDYETVEERECELNELITGFICDLIGVDDPEERDMVGFSLQDELEDLKYELEELLSAHGFLMYRPTIAIDDDGNEFL